MDSVWVFGYLGDAFISRVRDIFFQGGTRVESHIHRVTEKLVDPIKCRKAFNGGRGGEGGSRRAGRTELDGAIN